jgi:hypothetical protein
MNRHERRATAARQRRKNTKPRRLSLTVDLGAPRPLDQVSFNRATGEIELYYQGERVTPVRAFTSVEYDRAKGPKVLSTAEVDPEGLFVNPDVDLVRSDLFVAVDTNTKSINGETVSATGFAYCRGKGPVVTPDGQGGALFEYSPPTLALEFRNPNGSPEQVGWRLGMELVLMGKDYRPGLRVTLVVDSHLGDLSRFNDRSLPICDDFFLPQNFRLLYASADVRTQLCNQLITAADRAAGVVLDHLASGGGDPANLLEAVDRPYSHVRLWVADGAFAVDQKRRPDCAAEASPSTSRAGSGPR